MLQFPRVEYPLIEDYEVSTQEIMDMFEYLHPKSKRNSRGGLNYIKDHGATVESHYHYVEEVQTHVTRADIPQVFTQNYIFYLI